MTTVELFDALWACRSAFNGAIVVNGGVTSQLYNPAMPALRRDVQYNFDVRPPLPSRQLVLPTLPVTIVWAMLNCPAPIQVLLKLLRVTTRIKSRPLVKAIIVNGIATMCLQMWA